MAKDQRLKDAPPDDLVRFCAAHHARLVGFLSLQAGDVSAGEDAAQAALEKLCAHWGRLGSHPNREAWLYRVGINALRSKHRRDRREVHDDGSRPNGLVEPDHGSAATDTVAVRDALGSLSAKERTVVLMRYFLGCSVDETASVMGIPPNTVKTLAYRSRERLAPLLAVSDNRGMR